MPSVVIRVDPERRQWWKQTLRAGLPDFNVYLWDEDDFDKSVIDYAVVWMPSLGALASLPNLKAVFSVGAGVTHILRDPEYPRAVPIIRTVNEDLRKRMSEYVALHVLRFHRKLPQILQAQEERTWRQHVEPIARDVTVGLLGLGNLGRGAARVLGAIGYNLQGWSRRGRPVDGVRVLTGDSGLEELLATSDIVICMLPGTQETEGLLDDNRLSSMKEGAYLINVGRGETLDEKALAKLLNDGHIAGATLDVFRAEPLETDDPLWTVPNLLITSHTASAIEPATGGKTIIDNILLFEGGTMPKDVVDLKQGY